MVEKPVTSKNGQAILETKMGSLINLENKHQRKGCRSCGNLHKIKLDSPWATHDVASEIKMRHIEKIGNPDDIRVRTKSRRSKCSIYFPSGK